MIVSRLPASVPEAMPAAESTTPSGQGSFLEALAHLCGVPRKTAARAETVSSDPAATAGETEEAPAAEEPGAASNSEISAELLSALVAEMPTLFMRVPLSAMAGGAAPAATGAAPNEAVAGAEDLSAWLFPAASATSSVPSGAASSGVTWQGATGASEWMPYLMPPAAMETLDLPVEGVVSQGTPDLEQLALLNLAPASELALEGAAPKPPDKPAPQTAATASATPPVLLAKSPAADLPQAGAVPAPADAVLKTLDTLRVQTVNNVRYLIDRNGHTVSVRLVPESLGELHIHVQVRGEELTVRLVSANPLVRGALEDQMAGLRQALTRPGGPAPEIQVAANAGQGFSPGDDTRQGQGQWGAASRYDAAPAPSTGSVPSPKRVSTREEQRHDGTLNLLV